ncbi:RsmE family RNA methyltransferase [Salinispira pacifica]|uniref:Ribosomal RNA small subunit methyltransferase E n=1 Tax=Salinispira pacifica TaxID=1307761 RepID=V5WCK1_9SPIO|nr:RsmE family RNA methyltransferase [Salinispira pacifica]AHC13503.1 Ribosomal RNA small subunit methyltransferase E [Salinispira pacifica]
MKQFIVPQSLTALQPEDTIRLEGEDFHYLIRVRRLEPGAKIQIRDSAGSAALAEMHSVARDSLKLRILEFTAETGPGESRHRDGNKDRSVTGIPDLHLILGMPKGKKTDLILRQAGELGVSGITLVPSRNSQVKMTEAEFGKKAERWEKILREAVQQSNAPRLPLLNYVGDMNQACSRVREADDRVALGLFLHQVPLGIESLHNLLSDYSRIASPSAPPRHIYLAVGPEGGFSTDECEEMQKMAFHPVFLGDTILRTETAALYALAAVRTILLEGYSWQLKEPSAADQDW